MGPHTKERKAKEVVVLPWKGTQADMGTFVREWKMATGARDFRDKHKLNNVQWLKCVKIAGLLRAKGVPMKILKFHENFVDELDIKLLKQIAESV